MEKEIIYNIISPTSFENGRHKGNQQIQHDDDGEDVINAQKHGADPFGGKGSVRGEVEVVEDVFLRVVERRHGHDALEL